MPNELGETTFDDVIREELKDPNSHQGLAEASEAWDMVIKLARIRQEKGLTQEQLAEMVGTKQQNIARIENPAYEGHSLGLLRKVARALGMVVRVQFLPFEQVIEEEFPSAKKERKPVRYRTRSSGKRKKDMLVVREDHSSEQ